MKKAEYKVATSTNGFVELEETVSKMLNEGWKPVGGINFNAGYPYQAMARVISAPTENTISSSVKEGNRKSKSVGAQDAMRRINELT